MWCEKHSELFKNNGVPPERILNEIVKILAASRKTDENAARIMISQYAKDKPFCCRFGDEKLKNILIKISTEVEKKKRGY